jgi:Putative antitoxin of bacterial toxin-antitoxin system, YdaS/YdaT/Meiotically up-regulated gene 113
VTSFIYFIQAQSNGPIKIGTTRHHPARRMVKIQTDCPWPIKLLGAIEGTSAQEKAIHQTLSFFRTSGEWFSPHPTVMAAIETALRVGKPAEPPPWSKRAARDNHIARIISKLGGPSEVAKLVGLKQPAVSNWKKRGAFPPKTYTKIQNALSQRGLAAPNELWGMP